MLLYLLRFVFPLHYAFIHVQQAIYELPMRPKWGWFWKRLWNIAHLIFTVFLLVQMAEKHREIIYWQIVVARNLIESYVVADTVAAMCQISSKRLFNLPPNEWIPYYILIAFYAACYIQWYSTEFAIVIAGFAAMWWVFYVIFEEIHRREVARQRQKSLQLRQREHLRRLHLNRNEVSPLDKIRARYRMNRLWKLIAIVRPTNDVYLAKQFFPVVSESNNGSSILVVEWHSQGWMRSVTVWRISMVNGLQKKVHVLRDTADYDGFKWQGFESRGLVIIVVFRGKQIRFLVFDQRSGMEATSEWYGWHDSWVIRPLDGTCLRRHTDSNGITRGWRIRIVDYRLVRCECHPELNDGENWDELCRPSICITIIDIRPDLRPFRFSDYSIIVHHEELAVGPCLPAWSIRNPWLRTGSGLVGFIPRIRNDTTVFFFNHYDSTFGSINISELCKIDRSFGKYYYTPAPGERFLLDGARQRGLLPVVLSEDECIEVEESGVIWRSIFRAPTLRRQSLATMFQVRPELAVETSAIEFGATTGNDDPEDHFST